MSTQRIMYGGNPDDLKQIVSESGIKGFWRENNPKVMTFCSDKGGYMNFWLKPLTVTLRGKPQAQSELRENLSRIFGDLTYKKPELELVDSYIPPSDNTPSELSSLIGLTPKRTMDELFEDYIPPSDTPQN